MAIKRRNRAAVSGSPPEGFCYLPDVLTGEEQQDLLQRIAALDYERDTFRGQDLKRRYAQFGYAYVSTGRKVVAALPWPDFLAGLAGRILTHCPAGTRFNQCIVTHYPEGAGIS